ncbi:ubiquitin ligase (cullin) of SCF [Rhodotorula kratochvilovae]
MTGPGCRRPHFCPVHDNPDVDDTFSTVRDALGRVFEGATPSLDVQEYMRVYTAVSNLCRSPAGSRSSPDLHRKALYDLVSAQLKGVAQALFETLSELAGGELLEAYSREWEFYTARARYAARLFAYLDRHYVARLRDEGTQTPHLGDLALLTWRDHLLTPLQAKQQVTSALLDAVAQCRSSALPPPALDAPLYLPARAVIASLVAIDLAAIGQPSTAAAQHLDALHLLRSVATLPLRGAAQAYWRSARDAALAEDSLAAYAQKAAQWLEAETALAEVSDVSVIDCVLLTRPTRSQNLFIQILTRG